MTVTPCKNFNHNRMNVSVRYCSSCGEIVNEKIQQLECDEKYHAVRRKDRVRFCVDCGMKLFTENK